MRAGYCLQKGNGLLGSCGDECQSVVKCAGGMRHGRVWDIWVLLERRTRSTAPALTIPACSLFQNGTAQTLNASLWRWSELRGNTTYLGTEDWANTDSAGTFKRPWVILNMGLRSSWIRPWLREGRRSRREMSNSSHEPHSELPHLFQFPCLWNLKAWPRSCVVGDEPQGQLQKATRALEVFLQ